MFERDVQNVVDRYLSGAITEAQFLQEARPWPRYATDYRALVELAKKEGWAVIAANVRRLASEVAKSGQSALDRLTPEDRALIAREFQCPQDAYFERFAKAMTGHSPGTAATADQRATTDRALLVAVHERRDDGGNRSPPRFRTAAQTPAPSSISPARFIATSAPARPSARGAGSKVAESSSSR